MPLSAQLRSALDQGHLVLTPTALAADDLRAQFDAARSGTGAKAWHPANVLSWQQWLHSLWTGLILNGQETRLLLSAAQEDLLWREIVGHSLDPAERASVPAYAKLARSAYVAAAAYRITGRLTSSANTDDTEQFAAWADTFTRSCGRHDYLPAAHLTAVLREHVAHGRCALPALVFLAGFFDHAPSDVLLLEASEQSGTQLVRCEVVRPVPLSRLTFRAANEVDELRGIARWLRDVLPREADGRPVPSVHIVFAGTQPASATIDSIFREVLAPELNDISVDGSSAPWEFAAGRPLAEEPAIATLLRLLRGLLRPLSAGEATALLLSSHLGPEPAARDRDVAAQFDAWTVREGPLLRPEITYRELLRLAERSPFGAPARSWLQPLLQLLDHGPNRDTRQTYAGWSDWIRRIATTIGWPGEPATRPFDRAVSVAWERLLDQAATLDFHGAQVTFAEAFASLEVLLETAAVHLNTRPPIRILSPTDAGSMPCDILVLAQGSEGNWPPAARAHPLLPWSLRASADMPGTAPARSAARAEALTDALVTGTPHVLITYAAELDDAPQRLAPSLTRLTQQAAWTSLVLPSFPAEPDVRLEEIVDDRPLPPLPSRQVRGGARVLQLQAACGFRAFAEIRLRSVEPRTPDLGIDAARAGGLLHAALEVFWRTVASQANLQTLPADDLDDHLMAAIEHAFQTGFPSVEDAWGKAYRALQVERLFYLLRDWLDVEKQRGPFTVLGQEQQQRLTVGPLELGLRVDRVDSVEDGTGTVLIDYKTGANARPAAWETERPEDPQLPLYTLLPGATTLRGLAFARVRRGELNWAGVQAVPGLLGKSRVEDDFDALVTAWRDVLTRLAEQFAAGDHSVNPRSYPSTCAYCGQRFLCRLDPDLLLAATPDDAEALDEEPAHA